MCTTQEFTSTFKELKARGEIPVVEENIKSVKSLVSVGFATVVKRYNKGAVAKITDTGKKMTCNFI